MKASPPRCNIVVDWNVWYAHFDFKSLNQPVNHEEMIHIFFFSLIYHGFWAFHSIIEWAEC